MTDAVPEAVTEWLRRSGRSDVVRAESLSGGDISTARRLTLLDGGSVVLKTRADAPADFFPCEAAGLAALRAAGGPRVPDVLRADPAFLLLEDLRPRPPAPGFWPTLGGQLAALHGTRAARFGFGGDNYIGATRQPNPWTEDGCVFFAQHRLVFQARQARDAGRLDGDDLARAERLGARLPEIVPAQPPALVHGDLWRGNVAADESGRPALIDPATHWGWAEAEIGLTLLFGGFPASFYDAYTDAHPLAPGWRDRVDVYNFYHLLNHLNLFGGGYLSQVRSVLRRYT